MSRIKPLAAAGIAAVAVSMAAWSGIAFAESSAVGNGATTGDGTITFEHVSRSGSSVNVDGIKYKVSLAPMGADTTVSGSYAATDDMVKATADNPIVLEHVTSSDANERHYTLGAIPLTDLIDISEIGHAGVYKFQVTEAHEGGSSADSAWKYGDEQYYLRVWVVNGDSGLEFSQFAIYGIDEEDGAAAGDADDVNNTKAEYEAANTAGHKNAKAEFTSTYKKTTTLNISKQVTGDYGNKNHEFPVTVTLYVPSWYDEDVALTTDNNTTPDKDLPTAGTWSTIADSATDGTAGMKSISYTMNLHHGEVTTFTVPVGTYYNVVENADTNGKIKDESGLEYEPSISWSVDAGNASSGSVLPSGLSGIDYLDRGLRIKVDDSELSLDWTSYDNTSGKYTIAYYKDGTYVPFIVKATNVANVGVTITELSIIGAYGTAGTSPIPHGDNVFLEDASASSFLPSNMGTQGSVKYDLVNNKVFVEESYNTEYVEEDGEVPQIIKHIAANIAAAIENNTLLSQ